MKKYIYSALIMSLIFINSISANIGVKGGIFTNDDIIHNQTDDGGLHVAIDFDQYISEKISINYGLSLESQKISNINKNFNGIIFEVNGKYTIDENIYTFGGLNYPLALSSIRITKFRDIEPVGFIDFEPEGSIGFQLGAGYRINNNVSVELSYKLVDSNLGTISSGLLLASRYSF